VKSFIIISELSKQAIPEKVISLTKMDSKRLLYQLRDNVFASLYKNEKFAIVRKEMK